MFINLSVLLNKSEQEQEARETGDSELLSGADYMKAFQEIFSFPIILSQIHLFLQSSFPDSLFFKKGVRGVRT